MKQVELDSALGDPELPRDLLVTRAGCRQLRHLSLARRQDLQSPRSVSPLSLAFRELPGDRTQLSCQDLTDAGDQQRGWLGFKDNGLGAVPLAH